MTKEEKKYNELNMKDNYRPKNEWRKRSRKNLFASRWFLPIMPFKESKTWLTATPVLRGAVVSVLFDWWIAGCPEIDFTGNIRPLSCLGSSTYNLLEIPLKKALNEIIGALRAEHKEKKEISARQKAAVEKMLAVNKEKHDRRRALLREAAKLVEANDIGKLSFLPVCEDKKAWTDRQNSGRTDVFSRSEALNRQKTAKTKDFQPTLKDV